MVTYLRRLIDDVLDDVLEGLPAVMLTGPRACGKTTTALQRARTVLRLDDELAAAAFRADPDAFLASAQPPVLVDEWQEAAESMAAIKRAIDTGSGAGRFIVTGSVRARRTGASWPGTGRVVPYQMYGLTVGEAHQSATASAWLNETFDGAEPEPRTLPAAPTVVDYVDLALQGGFPEARILRGRARADWFPGYVDQLVHRDVAELAEVRTPDRLVALVRAVAANTAGVAALSTLAEAAGVTGATARTYLDLLADLAIIEPLPAWHSNRLSRLVKAPKYHVLDLGLWAHLMGVDATMVARNGDLLGRAIDSFVAAQILPLVAVSYPKVTAFHLRDANGRREVDLLLEGPRGRVVGIEVKAAAGVTARDARHLSWLRDELGDAFHRGIVFHTGPHTYQLGDRVWAMPIASLWVARDSRSRRLGPTE